MGKQLLYMYIDDFYGFKKVGFNFSTDVVFEVYESEQLVLQKGERSKLEGFWGQNISDISMLIGDNGSGKTSLMKVICRWICRVSEGCLPQEKGVLVFGENKRIGYIAFEKGDRLEICANIPKVVKYSVSQMICFTQDLCLLYFSNTMTNLGMENEILYDCSLYRRILAANEGENIPNGNVVEKYNRKEFQNQIETALKEDIKDFPVHYLQIEVHRLKFDTISKGRTSKIKEVSENLARLWEHYFGREQENKTSANERLIIELLKSLLVGMIKDILKPVSNVECNVNRLNEMIIYCIADCKNEGIVDGFKEFKEFLSDLILDNISGMVGKNRKENTEDFVEILQSEISSADGLLLETGDFDPTRKEIRVGHINIDSDNRKKFKRFWEAYKKINSFMEGVSFSWDASSGERNWVSLFSILASVSKENVWLLLDEPDNTLHPDWQRKILNEIIKVCNGENYIQRNVQIWITTHSPIMLSDMPGNSVIYLKNKENMDQQIKETFGQNIYALFNHAFFLHDGVIGTFASKKIGDVLEKLQYIENTVFNNQPGSEEIEQMTSDLERCKALTDLLAEPLFKRHLMDSITFLQKEIEKRKEEKAND